MKKTKDDLMEALISHLEVRGELGPEGNAATEAAIEKLTNEIASLDQKAVPVEAPTFCLWKTGYSTSQTIAAQQVSATEKAVKFRVIGAEKDRFFFMPKKALVSDKNEPSILYIAQWFSIDGYLSFLFNRYGNAYRR